MMRLRRSLYVFAALVCGTLAAVPLAACQAPDVANPFEIDREEYHAVYEATIESLREHRFAVNRQDRRFGVVTTRPLIAASVFEPWHDDNTTAHQVAMNTLNHQRRHVRVEIQPPDPAHPDIDAPDPADPDASVIPEGSYQLQVYVFLERRHHPPRNLHSGVFTDVDLRRRPRSHQPLVTEEGRLESTWRPVGRDHELERRLIADIIRRSIDIEPVYPPARASTASFQSQEGGPLEAEDAG